MAADRKVTVGHARGYFAENKKCTNKCGQEALEKQPHIKELGEGDNMKTFTASVIPLLMLNLITADQTTEQK